MNYLDHIAGRIERAIPKEARPTDDAQALYRLYALLVLTKGSATSLADVHNAWSVWMLERGANHESLVPFEDLPTEVQQEDKPFQRAIISLSEDLDKRSRSGPSPNPA